MRDYFVLSGNKMINGKFFFKGVAFIAVAKYSGIFIQLLIMAILSRLLTPADFGILAIANVFIVFFSLLSDFGIAPAIIQFRQLTATDLGSIFGFTFWGGLLLAFLFWAVSPLIVAFYQKDILLNVCRLLSIPIFFNTLNIVPNALLFRDKKFSIVAYRNVCIQVICGVIASITAYKGIGVYALLVSPVLGSFLNVTVNVIYMHLGIQLFPSPRPLRLIYRFSLYQFLFNFVNYFGRNLDKLIIGKLLNINALSYYDKSYRLMLMPVDTINSVLSPVLHPYLSQYQNDLDKIFQICQRMTRFLLNISFPVAAILLFTGKELILLIFGSQWLGAVDSFCILTVSVATQIPLATTGVVLQACNQTRLLFRLGMLNVAISIGGLFIGAFCFRTIEAVSVAFVLANIFSIFNSFYAIYRYCFGVKFCSFLRLLITPVSFYLFLVIILYPFYQSLSRGIITDLLVKMTVWGGFTFLYFQYFTPYRPWAYIQKFWQRNAEN